MYGTPRTPLPGEETLLGSWGALAAESPGAHLVYTQLSFAAVFPHWKALNNAILLDPPTVESASSAFAELDPVYSDAGIASWALWLPSRLLDLDQPGHVTEVDGMVRDTTTLVMTRDVPDGLPSHPGVLPTTVEVAARAGDMPVSAGVVPDAYDACDIKAWVLIEDEVAVSGAWSFRNGREVGIYAVGTAHEWRRRGLAAALMLHVLADAYRNGARTASLQSTAMGVPLYRSLGFRPVGRYDEWIPAPATRALSRKVERCESC
jgi:GNAT superfamily N-acetyltransferase